MRILADFHHSSLFYSYYLTLEKRLGYEVFAPIGMEWEPDYWQIHKPYGFAKDTARQYLDLDNRYIPKDGTPPLINKFNSTTTHYQIYDISHNYIRKHITLEQFKEMDIDVIIASIPDHAITFKKLRDTYKPKTKLVFQMGNAFNIEELIRDGYIKNLMGSVKKFDSKCHSVFYHQEIDQSVFKYSPPSNEKIISSFVIGLPQEEVFLAYRNMLTEFDSRAYASKYGPFIPTIKEMAQIMAKSMWGFQKKGGGDGFGHILYSWAFSGRPLIIDFNDYRNKLGEELLTDGLTAIDIGGCTVKEGCERIRQLSNPTNLSSMCLNISNRVKALVNYEKEAESIRTFFETLV